MRLQLLNALGLVCIALTVGCGSGLDVSAPMAAATAGGGTTAIPVKVIYYVSAASGNMGGVSGADTLCTNSLPSGVTTAKALVVDGSTRVACTTANCGGGASEHVDWVLAANTQYKLSNGTSIGTTNAVGLFTFPLDNAIGAAVVQTGLTASPAWTTGGTCTSWGATGGSESCGFNGTTSSSIIDINGSGCTCNAGRSVICVQQ